MIALPHGLHCEVCVAALRAGCHVLVEKPMAVSVAECNEMIRVAVDCDRRLLVAETAGYDPGAVLTGRRLADGELGTFFTGASINSRFYFHGGRPAWFLDPALSGGGMFANVGVHRLSLTRAALPRMAPVSVSASVSHLTEHSVEACTSLIVRYAAGGSMLYEEIGYYERPDWLDTGRHFVFERGMVAWDQTTWRMMRRDGSQVAEPLPPVNQAYAPVYADVLSAIRGHDIRVSAAGNALDVAVAQAAYSSARTGHEVDLTAPEWRVVPPESET